MSRWRAAVAALALGLLLAAGRRAELEILITVDADVPELVGRLRAELEHLGFRVTIGPTARAPLEDQARAAGVDAALRVTPDRRGVEVWAVNTESRASALREVVLPAGEADPGVVAVRAVELVRAAFLELDVELPAPDRAEPRDDAGADDDGERPSPPLAASAAPDAAPVVPVPATRSAAPGAEGRAAPARRVERAEPVAALGAGPAVVVSGGGVPPAGQLALAGRLRLGDHAALGAVLGYAIVGGTLRGSEGSAEPRAHVAGLDLAYRGALGGRWVLRAGVGAAGLWLQVRGAAVAPYESRAAATLVALPYGVAGVEAWPWASLGIAADVRAGVPVPDPDVHFADRVVATWGAPVVVAGVALVAGWRP
ncbi:MAG: hypothetical protein IT376_20005 [Polyangiaceae bacterium]|nr:hypothetical protein [Polyangiaceae bacterium]